MQRILVVEDEMQIARNIRDYLEVAGFQVTVVGAWARAEDEGPTTHTSAPRRSPKFA